MGKLPQIIFKYVASNIESVQKLCLGITNQAKSSKSSSDSSFNSLNAHRLGSECTLLNLSVQPSHSFLLPDSSFVLLLGLWPTQINYLD